LHKASTHDISGAAVSRSRCDRCRSLRLGRRLMCDA
jgi:hypothetical protein